MLYTAITSTILLAILMAVARYEFSHNVRLGGTGRLRVDRQLVRLHAWVLRAFHHVLDFIHRDLVAKTLHIISYVALMSVRSVERRLASLTELLRSVRKRQRGPHAPRAHDTNSSNDV